MIAPIVFIHSRQSVRSFTSVTVNIPFSVFSMQFSSAIFNSLPLRRAFQPLVSMNSVTSF